MQRVATRLALAGAGRWFRWALLAAAGVFAAGLLVARLLAVIPDCFGLLSLLVVPGVAFLVAAVSWRRPPVERVAHAIDGGLGSRDLFLTAVLADEHAAYAPLVAEGAERVAAEARAARIVPLRWRRGAVEAVLALGVLALAVIWLPQLDPFKKEAARQAVAQQVERLRESERATEVRAAVLQKEAGAVTEAQRAVAELERAFEKADVKEPAANLAKMNERQKEIGQLWRQMNEEKLRSGLGKAARQSFGALDGAKMEEWRKELEKGETAGIKKEIESLREQLQRAAAMPEGSEREAARAQVAQQLGAMAEALGQQAGSKPLDAALTRALEQLEMAKGQGMSPEAMQAAAESMGLGAQELEQMAQSMKDLQALEQALKNIQMAKQLNAQGQLEGQRATGGMAGYEAMYRQMLAGQGGGSGEGMKGPGRGEGGKALEDESLESRFKSEKADSALAGGKMLLEWTTKEVSEPGARAADYEAAAREVRQGVSEAIVQEQVPPVYHGAIQKYFDSLPAGK